MAADPIPITDLKVAAALAALRTEFSEWGIQEFPLSGWDCLRQMNIAGLCTQEEAEAAMKVAQQRHPDRDLGLPTAEEVRGIFRDDMSDEFPF